MAKDTQTVAVMDIGSNTSLLLIARLFSNKKVEILEDRLFYTRLAEGFHRPRPTGQKGQQGPGRYIQPQALKRQGRVFEQARELVRHYSVQQVKCVATAASRQAKNKEQLIALGRQYGFCVNIISPEAEARSGRTGALFKLPVLPKTAVVLDIGGASTEISSEQDCFSLPMGSVNLTERFLPTDPPTEQETERLEHHIKQEIHRIPFSFPQKSILVATAGIPTTLAFMQNQSPDSSAFHEIHGTTLSLKQVEEWHKNLFCLPLEERKKLKGLPIYRADVMPAGLSVLKQIMHRFCWKQCVVSMTGLRYGLLCQFYAPLNKSSQA